MSDFVVIDTEGTRLLREIAIIDSEGKLIYEAFSAEHPDNEARAIAKKPLRKILQDFTKITQNKIIVFHYAAHDLAVLKDSFKQAKLTWQYLRNVRCTYAMAQKHFPNRYSHSLEHLAKQLNLKVDNYYFNPRQAHTAQYDAQFTYQLYLTLNKFMNPSTPVTINPFSSSRVDNPFQNHPDNSELYRPQYTILESIIDDIKHDRNHQSKGVVIIGEPGTGKTHLIMRLARKRLQHNRLLFIPCPNDANTIKYHTYSCILKSLNEKIPDSNYNQLEYLLAYSFVRIIGHIKNPPQKIIAILEKTQHNPLELYNALGSKGSQLRRDNWDYIEKVASFWWSSEYGTSGYSPEIIKGIVKFCRYSDPNYKQLVKRWLAADELEAEELNKIGLNNWHEETSKEDFSLEAIAVLGRLSLLNEPLILVFDQLEMLGLEHNKDILFNFGEAVKEVFTRVPNSLIILNLFPDRWQHFQQFFDGSVVDRISQQKVYLQPPTEAEIKDILELKAEEVGTTLDNLFAPLELQQIIQERRSIRSVVNYAADYYRHKFKNIPLPNKPTENINLAPSIPADDIPYVEVLYRLNAIEAQNKKLEKLFSNIAQALNNFSLNNDAIALEFNPIYKPQHNTFSSPPPTNSLENKIIDYIAKQKTSLQQTYSDNEILMDEKDSGKLKDILLSFSKINKIEIDSLPSKRALPPHIVIKNKNICIGFISSFNGKALTSRLKNYNEIIATKETIKFQLWRDVRSDKIKPETVAAREINKLKNTKNGSYNILDKDNRLTFELIYKTISDIYNQDLELDLDTELITALTTIADYFKDYWLLKLIF